MLARRSSRAEVVAAANAELDASRHERDERASARARATGETGLRFHLPEPAGTLTLERISTSTCQGFRPKILDPKSS